MEHVLKLLSIMKSLRDPDEGCPWDQQQNFSTIIPYTLEEAYEVADAITRDDMAHLCVELGDLLFHVVYLSQLAEERDCFKFGDVVKAINEKMIRRHPHVFGDAQVEDTKAQTVAWDAIKRQERHGEAQRHDGLLNEVTPTIPALPRAQKLQAKAATVGFDWRDSNAVLDKIAEEFGEVREAVTDGDRKKIQDEIGDLLFACTNLARHFQIDAESALRATNYKFESRFAYVEQALESQGVTLDDASLETMDGLWNEAKTI